MYIRNNHVSKTYAGSSSGECLKFTAFIEKMKLSEKCGRGGPKTV